MISHVDNPVLELHNLTVTYDNKPAVWNVDYTIPEGNLIGIIGPNGSGKTTMLKAVMGLEKPSSGYVKIFGNDLDKVRDKVAYVPQRGSVDWDFPTSVYDAVLMGRYTKQNLFKRTSRRDREITNDCIKKVQLENFAKRQISQLSGGQQQRVFLARTLAQQAEIFFFDEPFVGVDRKTKNIIFDIFHELQEQGKIVMVVSHDLGESIKNYSDILLLNKKIIAFGRREEVLNQRNLDITYENHVLPFDS